MLRSIRYSPTTFVTRFPFLAVMLLFLVCGVQSLWATLPPVAFDGVATTVSTGSTSLSNPAGVAVDSSGNVYIADTGNNQIVEVTSAGAVSVLSLTGLSPALSLPRGIAVDGSGNLYIADSGNNRIVELSGGSASVVAMGSVTLNSPRGAAVDGSGNLYIADTGNNQIVKVPAGGAAAVYAITGLGTALNAPVGLAVDASGKLYIADSANNRIVQVTSGGVGSPVNLSGLGTALNAPSGVTVDRDGNIFVADPGNNRVVSVTSLAALKTGSLTLASPKGVAVDVFGSVYIADTSNNRINSVQIKTVGYGHTQVGSSTGKTFLVPYTVQAGVELTNLTIWTMGAGSNDFMGANNPDTPCVATTYVSTTTCTIAIQYVPAGPGLRQGGMILTYIASSVTQTITVPLYGFGDAPQAALSPGTASIISSGAVPTLLPFQLALDGAGNMYSGDYSGQNVVKIPAGGGTGTVVSTGSITLNDVTGVALDGAGNLFIADHLNSRIVVVTPDGASSVLTISGLSPGLNEPTGLAVDVAGNLYISDWQNGRIVKVSSLVRGSSSSGVGSVIGTGTYTFGSGGVTGVAVDASGTIYIADRSNNRVVKVTAAGAAALVSVAGLSPGLSNPQGVAVDGMGNVYIADSGNSRVVQVTAGGAASVVKTPGLTSPTTLSAIFGVSIDPSGNVFIPDWTNSRIVKVNVGGASLAFAATKVGLTSTDSPRTATVTNLGNQPLAFLANPTYTANFSQDSGNTNPCTNTTTLAPGMVCDVMVDFTPQSVGSLSANIAATNNSLNVSSATQQISVGGTGLTPGDTTATAVATAPTTVDIAQTFTITATVTDTAAGHTSTVPTGGVTFIDTVGSTATSLNGGSAVTLSGGVATLTGVTLSVSGSHTITANYAGVSGSFLSSTNTAAILVRKLPAVALDSSLNPSTVSNSVTFTATVSATAGTPTGSVDFYDGSTFLGSGTLASGVATYATSSLASGTHSITATYGGDSGFSSLTSAAVSQVVADFSLSIPSGHTPSATVAPGGTATYTIALAPSAGTTFPSAVTLVASGAPTGSTVTITPATLAAGDSATQVTIAVQVPVTAAAVRQASLMESGWTALLAGVLLLPLGGRLRRFAGKGGFVACLFLLGLMSVGAMLGCGGSSTTPPPQPRVYVIAVTATSAGVSHTTNLNLTVQ